VRLWSGLESKAGARLSRAAVLAAIGYECQNRDTRHGAYHPPRADELAGEPGPHGLTENDLVRGFCERCCVAGLDLSRSLIFIDTLHPIFEGRGFRWNDADSNESDSFEYGPTGENDDVWRRSVFFHMLVTSRIKRVRRPFQADASVRPQATSGSPALARRRSRPRDKDMLPRHRGRRRRRRAPNQRGVRRNS
jgi:hypothetical protein